MSAAGERATRQRITGIGGLFFKARDPERLRRWYEEYLGRPEQRWMLNFRVDDLDAFVAQLRSEDVEVELDPEEYPNGRFARLYDPEGNPIELWEAV